MRRMQQMAGQMGMFNPMAIPFGAYGAYAQAVSGGADRVGVYGQGFSANSAQNPRAGTPVFARGALCFWPRKHCACPGE